MTATGLHPAPESLRLPARILVASPSRIFREALAEAIRARGGRSVEAIDCAELAGTTRRYGPDVVLIDAQDERALYWVRLLTAERERTVVAVGVEPAADAIGACAESGASGLLLQ